VRRAVRSALERNGGPPATPRAHLTSRLGPWLAVRAAAFAALLATGLTSLLLGAMHAAAPATAGSAQYEWTLGLEAPLPVALVASPLPALCFLLGQRLWQIHRVAQRRTGKPHWLG
jgi:hypothetical protein